MITGGAGLLGSEFVRSCAKEGAKVIILDIDSKKGTTLAKNTSKETGNQNIVFLKCDTANERSVKNTVSLIQKKFHRIDALVNCAYPRNKNYGRQFEEVTYEDFCENINLHLGGYFLMSREVSKVMTKNKSGNIIFMGSIYGVVAPKFDLYKGTNMAGVPVEYAVMKAGTIHLAKYLAAYLGPSGIRVNAISPGGVFANQSEPFLSRYISKVRLKPQRMAKEKDISDVLLFLLSDASKYITGQNIIVDGGWTL